jgi:hypothetical protein
MHETGSAIPQQELHWMTNHNLFIKNWESVGRRAGKCLIWLKVPESSPMRGGAASCKAGSNFCNNGNMHAGNLAHACFKHAGEDMLFSGTSLNFALP